MKLRDIILNKISQFPLVEMATGKNVIIQEFDNSKDKLLERFIKIHLMPGKSVQHWKELIEGLLEEHVINIKWGNYNARLKYEDYNDWFYRQGRIEISPSLIERYVRNFLRKNKPGSGGKYQNEQFKDVAPEIIYKNFKNVMDDVFKYTASRRKVDDITLDIASFPSYKNMIAGLSK